MRQDNSTIRDKSLRWWANLPNEQMHQLRDKYFPDSFLLTADERLHIFLSEYPEQAVKEEDILEWGGEKEGTTQKVATALLRHASSEHKLVSEYTQTEKQMFRAGFIHGDVQGNESGCIWGLEQGRAENTSLKARIVVLEDALRKMIAAFYDEGMESDQWLIMDEAKEALNQK